GRNSLFLPDQTGLTLQPLIGGSDKYELDTNLGREISQRERELQRAPAGQRQVLEQELEALRQQQQEVRAEIQAVEEANGITQYREEWKAQNPYPEAPEGLSESTAR